MQNITKAYNHLVTEVEEEIRRLRGYYEDTLQCRPSCDGCCMSFTLFPIEAEIIRLAYEKLNAEEKSIAEQQAGKQNDQCPFLIRSKCCIYPSRPLICRTHGLPIAYIDEENETIEVSACQVNFPDDMSFEREGLLFMDPFNAKLAEINQEFASIRGLGLTVRITMHEIILDKSKEMIPS